MRDGHKDMTKLTASFLGNFAKARQKITDNFINSTDFIS